MKIHRIIERAPLRWGKRIRVSEIQPFETTYTAQRDGLTLFKGWMEKGYLSLSLSLVQSGTASRGKGWVRYSNPYISWRDIREAVAISLGNLRGGWSSQEAGVFNRPIYRN